MMKRWTVLFICLFAALVAPVRAADQITYTSQPEEAYIFLNDIAYVRDSLTLPAGVSVRVVLPTGVYPNTLIIREGDKRIFNYRIRPQENQQPAVEWMSEAGTDARQVKLEYLVSGLSWLPQYDMTILGGTVDFNFLAQIQNTAFDLQEVTVHLVAGRVDTSAQVGQQGQQAAANQAIAGYEDGSGSVPSVGAATIQYMYDIGRLTSRAGEVVYQGIVSQPLPARRVLLWNAPSDQQVSVIYKVRNESDVPFADGIVQAYQNGIFVGSDPMEITPVGSEGSITVGRLQDVRVSRAESRISIQDATYYYQVSVSLKLANFGKDPVEIQVVDVQNPSGEAFQFAQEPAREAGNLLRWTVTIQPNETVTLEYQYKTR
jgi:hypothetical protein